MRTKKSLFPRLMAVFLSAVLLIGMLPLGAMAASKETTPSEPPGASAGAGPTEDSSGGTSGDPTDESPGEPTDEPSQDPTDEPSQDPTDEPSQNPTDEPSQDPTDEPSQAPTDEPSQDPTDEPSQDPTDEPSQDPTDEPSQDPTDEPSKNPTDEPSQDPTDEPSQDPTDEPSQDPTDEPSKDPTDEPSKDPTDEPSQDPTDEPSQDPTDEPSQDPTDEPSQDPPGEGSADSDTPGAGPGSSRAVHAVFQDTARSQDANGSAHFQYTKASGAISSTTISGMIYHYVDDISNPGYCLQPDLGAPLNLYVTEESTTVGGANTGSRGSKIWTNNLSKAQQDAIAMILLYGAPNNVWSTDSDKQSGYFVATQVMVWEIILGLRSTTFPYNYTSASNVENLYNLFKLDSDFVTGYADILGEIQNYNTIPSFTSSTSASAPTITLKSDGNGYYTATVTDTNGVLSKFNFTDPTGNVTFSKSGNALTISAKALPSNTIFTGTKSVYSTTSSTFNLYYPGSDSYQTMLTVGVPATQTIPAYLNLEIEETGKPFTLQKSADTSASCYAQISGNPMYSLAGAKYQVSVGSTVMETLTTNSNGKASSSLEYDIGTKVKIKEISAPPGYKLNSTTYTFTISDGDNTFSVSDVPVFDPPFAITKVDKTTGNPQGNSSFSGAVFKWEYFTNTNWSGTAARTWYFSTNQNGIAQYLPSYFASGYSSDALYVDEAGNYAIPLGTVKITEIQNSLGYIVLPEPLYVSIEQDSSTGNATITWNQSSWNHIVNIASGNYGVYEPADTSLYGGFTLTKTDKDTGAKLAGAKFQVINNSTNSVKIGSFAEAEPGKVCFEFTTDSNGQFSSGKIFPLGSYTIKEITAPPNHIVNTDWAGTFTVTKDSTKDFSFTCQDTGIGQIKLIKTTNTGSNLSGWGISVYSDSACNNLVGSYITGNDGTITTGQITAGTYYVKETSAPSGVNTGWWAMDTSVKTVTVSAGKTATVQFNNTQYGRIQVTKSTNTGANLSGWVFDIKNSSGTTVATLTTGADGTATSGNLLPGAYTVTERSNGNSYWNCDVTAKSVTVVAGQTANVNVINTHCGRIKVAKTTNTGKNLDGWIFDIKDSTGKTVATLTTGADGTATSGNLVPGTYTVTERSNGDSFWVCDVSTKTVSVTAGNTSNVNVTNTHHGKIKILKALDTDGQLGGWKFKITNSATGREIEGSPFTTNDKGEFETGILLPGKYVVEELFEKDSLFYCKSENPQTVTVVAGEVTNVNFVNALRPGRIEIEKVNFSGSHLAGAKFLLEWSEDGINWFPVTYSSKTDVVKGGCNTKGLTNGCLTTDSSGIIAFECLYPTLQYRVTELEAPEGYILLTDYAFVDVLPIDDLEVKLTVYNSNGYVLPSTGVMDNTFFLITTGAFITTFAMAIGLVVVYYNVSNGRHAVRRKNNYSPKYLRKDK